MILGAICLTMGLVNQSLGKRTVKFFMLFFIHETSSTIDSVVGTGFGAKSTAIGSIQSEYSPTLPHPNGHVYICMYRLHIKGIPGQDHPMCPHSSVSRAAYSLPSTYLTQAHKSEVALHYFPAIVFLIFESETIGMTNMELRVCSLNEVSGKLL